MNSAGVATIIRIPFVQVLAITDDFLFATVDVAIWSTVEPGVGIIAAAALALRPLFKKFYGLSSRGTTKANAQSFKGSNGQTNHKKEKLYISQDSFEGFDDDAVEMGPAGSTSVVRTTSTSNHKKGGRFFSGKSRSSNSSDEEKGTGWKVQVEKTVEVSRHTRDSS